MTFVAALRYDGLSAPCVFDGPINALCFRAYVEQVLAPTMEFESRIQAAFSSFCLGVIPTAIRICSFDQELFWLWLGAIGEGVLAYHELIATRPKPKETWPAVLQNCPPDPCYAS